MTKILSIFILLITFFCAKTDFKVLQATSQDWAGGMPASGRGTYYNFTLLAQTNSNLLQFKTLWIGDKNYAFTITRRNYDLTDTNYSKSEMVVSSTFKKGDTLYIRAQKYIKHSMRGEPLGEVNEEPQIALPYKYKGVALFGYNINKKLKYKTIDKFKVLQMQAYP